MSSRISVVRNDSSATAHKDLSTNATQAPEHLHGAVVKKVPPGALPWDRTKAEQLAQSVMRLASHKVADEDQKTRSQLKHFGSVDVIDWQEIRGQRALENALHELHVCGRSIIMQSKAVADGRAPAPDAQAASDFVSRLRAVCKLEPSQAFGWLGDDIPKDHHPPPWATGMRTSSEEICTAFGERGTDIVPWVSPALSHVPQSPQVCTSRCVLHVLIPCADCFVVTFALRIG